MIAFLLLPIRWHSMSGSGSTTGYGTGFGASPLLQARADTAGFGAACVLPANRRHPQRPLCRR